MNLVIFAAFVLLILGLFNPQASLFWYNKQRTRVLSAVIYGVLFVALICFKSTDNDKASQDVMVQPASTDSAAVKIDTGTTLPTAVSENPEKIEEERIIEKLKTKAARDWPNDYTTQEYWINQELEDYRYMLTIPVGPIKRQAENDWPYDYTTQKYWYDEQIEAKERLRTN
jgi:hypothetical protein